jgi:hypothetical protein
VTDPAESKGNLALKSIDFSLGIKHSLSDFQSLYWSYFCIQEPLYLSLLFLGWPTDLDKRWVLMVAFKHWDALDHIFCINIIIKQTACQILLWNRPSFGLLPFSASATAFQARAAFNRGSSAACLSFPELVFHLMTWGRVLFHNWFKCNTNFCLWGISPRIIRTDMECFIFY